MSIIETQRLLLRPYEEGDREDYLALVTDPLVMRHVDEGVATEEVAEDWWHRLINGLFPSGLRWCARTTQDSRFAGHAMINYTRPNNACELGYILPEDMWGNGYATEISRTLTDYSRDEMGLNEIFGTVDENHEASIKVLKKTGMEFYRYDFDEDGRYLVYVLKHK